MDISLELCVAKKMGNEEDTSFFKFLLLLLLLFLQYCIGKMV